MKEERILYDTHEFVGGLFTCTVAFVCCSLSKNGEGLCKCLFAFEVLSVQMIALKLSEMH